MEREFLTTSRLINAGTTPVNDRLAVVVNSAVSGGRHVKLPTAAGQPVIGILISPCDKDNYPVDLATKGRFQIEAGAAFNVGDLVKADANGRAIVAAATLATALSGTNNDILFTAIGAFQGTPGNFISVEFTDPDGNSQPLGVTVHGGRISVSLATGEAGAITSTADEVKAAILAHAVAGLMVNAVDAAGNDGSGVVTAMAEAGLTGGEGEFGRAEQAADALGDFADIQLNC